MAETQGVRPQILNGVRRAERRRASWGLALGMFAVVSVLSACALGPLELSLREVASVLTGHGEELARTVVLQLRLPRALLALGVGSGLALAGTAFQAILRNPLADPYTIGVSTGAAFGAALAISLGLGASLLGKAALPLCALAGAGVALFAVLSLARSGGRLRRETLVLAGIVVSTFLAALIAIIKAVDEDSVLGIVFWVMGSFQGRGYNELLLLAPFLAVGGGVLLLGARELDLLTMGEVQARQLGLDAQASRRRLLAAASLLTAACVAVAGVIGFVGLVAPHLMRLIVGGRHGPLLAFSALTGGLALLWSDVLARSLPGGAAELPVGVVTALLGGPFFLFLLRRNAGQTI